MGEKKHIVTVSLLCRAFFSPFSGTRQICFNRIHRPSACFLCYPSSTGSRRRCGLHLCDPSGNVGSFWPSSSKVATRGTIANLTSVQGPRSDHSFSSFIFAAAIQEDATSLLSRAHTTSSASPITFCSSHCTQELQWINSSLPFSPIWIFSGESKDNQPLTHSKTTITSGWPAKDW